MIQHLFSVANIAIKATPMNLMDQEYYDFHPIPGIVACTLPHFYLEKHTPFDAL